MLVTKHGGCGPYSQSTTCQNSGWRARATSRLLSIAALSACVACSSAPPAQTVRTVTVEVPRPDPTPSLPDPQPLELLPVDWTVVTAGRLPAGSDWTLMALTPQQYRNLSLNTAELLRYVREAKWRLGYYRGVNPAKPPQE